MKRFPTLVAPHDQGSEAANLIITTRFHGQGMLRFLTMLTAMSVLSAASCTGCDGSSSRAGGAGGGGSSSSSWLVGQGGLMLNVDLENAGGIGRYPLDFGGDLLGIACWGPKQAWVVGEGGTVLTTDDAGKEWRSIDVGVRTRLRAVARAAEGVVYVAGDAGEIRVSSDVGRSWQAIPAPSVVWSSVAIRHDGGPALLTTVGGEIYRHDRTAESLVRVGASAAGALHAVAVSHDGATAAAVGDHGVMLVSFDGGVTWVDRPSGTTRALRDVWVAGERGGRVIAVGDGGVVVDGATGARDGATPKVLGAGGDLRLRALHLSASGHGAIVGDEGMLFVTDDGGATWTQVSTGDRRNVYAVDALEDSPHL